MPVSDSPGDTDETPADQRASRRAIFQEVNARIDALADHWVATELLVLCECGAATCTSRIEISRVTYQAMRADAGRYLVVSDHLSDADHVVQAHDGFTVAERT